VQKAPGFGLLGDRGDVELTPAWRKSNETPSPLFELDCDWRTEAAGQALGTRASQAMDARRQIIVRELDVRSP